MKFVNSNHHVAGMRGILATISGKVGEKTILVRPDGGQDKNMGCEGPEKSLPPPISGSVFYQDKDGFSMIKKYLPINRAK